MAWFAGTRSTKTPGTTPRCRLQVETLETRVVPYSTSGNLWPHPELVTVSFMPDGTNLGGPSSNLFATFNAAFGSSAAWQNAILKALQTWAQYTNLNFSVIADNGAASGSGDYQQGDAGMGDIRIGGFNFENSGLLALGYLPPDVNNYSIAGDLGFNTGKTFKINGMDYDLFTVALHEVGHTLGLGHSSSGAAIMYSTYSGVETGLYSDDIAGIRSIYGGARLADFLDAFASNGSFATASDLSGYFNPNTFVAQLSQLDITATTDYDYYAFTVPEGGSGSMRITVQSRGLSLLAPSLKVYNSAQTQVGGATGTGYQGSTIGATLNVTAGQTYYVRVAGANGTAFGTGAYGLTVALNGAATPVIASPDTQSANGNPLNGGGGLANRTDSDGVSVSSLLVPIDRYLNRFLGGSWLGRLSDQLLMSLASTVDLPFADAYGAGKMHGESSANGTDQALAGLITSIPASLISTVSGNFVAAPNVPQPPALVAPTQPAQSSVLHAMSNIASTANVNDDWPVTFVTTRRAEVHETAPRHDAEPTATSFVLPRTETQSHWLDLLFADRLTDQRQQELAEPSTLDRSAALMATLFVAMQFASEYRIDKKGDAFRR